MAVVDPKNTTGRGQEYRKHLEKIAEHGKCPFCPKQLHKEHPNPIILENESWLATDSAYPYPGSVHHILLIAKKHIETLSEIDDTDWAAMKEIINRVVKARSIKGAAFLMRFGATSHTGATVNHLHAHIISGEARVDKSNPIMTVVGFSS